jgi:hypothetical protein
LRPMGQMYITEGKWGVWFQYLAGNHRIK